MRLSWPFRPAHDAASVKSASTVAPVVQRAPLEEWRDVEPPTGLSAPLGLTADPRFGHSLTGHRSLPAVLQHVARGGALAPMTESAEGRPSGPGHEGIPSRTAAATRSYRLPQRSAQADVAGLPEPAGPPSDETTAPAVSLPAAPIPSRVAPKSRSAQGSSFPTHALTLLPAAQRSAIENDTRNAGRVLLSEPPDASTDMAPQSPTAAEPTATAGPSQAATQAPPVASWPRDPAVASTQHSAAPGSGRAKRPSLGQSRRAGLGSPLATRPSSSQSLDSSAALGSGLQPSPKPEEAATVPMAFRPASEPQAQRRSSSEQRSRTELAQVDDKPAPSAPTTYGASSGGAVRIDRSQGGASAAAELGADAFTSGDTIVMPSSHGPLDRGRGQALLAHELVHVGQQRSMGSSLPAEHTAAGQDLEREAQSAEVSVEQGHRSGPPAAALPLAHRGTLQASVETSSASHSGHARRASSVAMAAAGPGAGVGDSASYHLQASHTPPQQTVPAPQRSALSSTSSGTAGTAGTASAAGPDAHDDIDEVSRRVYERIRLRLRRELLLDRERGGYLTDPR